MCYNEYGENMNNYSYIIKYIICLCLLYISLFLISNMEKSNVNDEPFVLNLHDIEKRSININKNDYVVEAYYPKFNSNSITKEMKDFVYDYINDFIKDDEHKSLNINYEVYFNDEILNIFFTIDNSLNDTLYYKSFNYNLVNDDAVAMSEYELDYGNIITLLSKKYSKNVVDIISLLSHEEYNFKFTENGIHIYFNSDLFDTPYVPELYLNYDNDALIDTVTERKYKIAFTFDDGPGSYTKDLVDTLKLNDSTATFFMLGNRMKFNQETVLYVIDNGMEIGSHSYSHKNLDKITEAELQEEINSTTIIFNEITGKNIELFRPPYGNVNSSTKEKIPFVIVKWNVDTEDWLYRNVEHTYNHIISHACDGCIVLMHDIYKETLEAVKMSIPALQEMGYDVVSVSELAESKKIEMVPGNIYRSFNNYNLPF